MTGVSVTFRLPQRVAGFSLDNVNGRAQPDATVMLETHGFYTSDDGPKLYQLLDGVYANVIRPGSQIQPELIHTALINIRGDDATMILNAPISFFAVTKGATFEVGQPVMLDDLADIASLRLEGYELPADGCLIFIFQQGWRRAIYFDLRGGAPGETPEPLGDVGALLGSLWGALLHRDRIRMAAPVLARMADAGWFPFTRLSTATTVDLYRHFELNWDATPVIEKVQSELEPRLAEIVEGWASKPAFTPHMSVLRDAARLYGVGEHRAAATMIWPKVEGVLRHIYAGTKDRPNAHDLRRELVGRFRANVNGYTALLPERFITYLETYYYASFDLSAGDLPESRHAFAHGVGPDDRMLDPTYALRLFLMLDQVFFCLSRMKEPS